MDRTILTLLVSNDLDFGNQLKNELLTHSIDCDVNTFCFVNRLINNKEIEKYECIILNDEDQDIRKFTARIKLIPMIILSDRSDMNYALSLIRSGVADYIPINESSDFVELLVESVRRNADKYREVKKEENFLNKLRESEEQLKLLIQQLPYPVQVFDAEGTAVMTNPAFLKLMGLSEDVVTGVYNIFECPIIKKINMYEIVKRIYSGEKLFEDEIVVPLDYVVTRYSGLKLGKVYLEALMFPIYNKNGKLEQTALIIRDITDNKLLEMQLLQAEKMKAVGMLASGVAHDFGNYLQAINTNCEIMLKTLMTDDPIIEEIHDILQVAKEGTHLTHQLLLFSSNRQIDLELMNLNTIIDDFIKILSRLIGENIKIVTKLDTNLWHIQADKSKLDQVIMNIVVNARDAIAGKGKITITTENCEISEKESLHEEDISPGRYILLTIEDNGRGMEQETINHIFEPFFTLREQGVGHGLGLSVVYGIIQQHGGVIHVESTPGEGTKFKILLPASIENMIGDLAKPVQVPDLKGTNERILIIEDEERVAKAVSKALSLNGYEIENAYSFSEALETYKIKSNKYDLLLCDVILPDGNGIDLIEKLIEIRPDLKVIFTSGNTYGKLKWTLISKKGYKFLWKPFSLNELLLSIRSCLTNNQ